ncbi:MAG: protein kinase [Archangium sp.]|nr:protein kinase [Archangium sp.]
MTPAVACPDENELVRFARGALDDTAGSQLSSHLDTCASCRHAVAEAASEEPLAPPTVTAGARVGRYEVDALLGSGAMGAVFSARDASLHRRVAIKLLHTAGDELSRARLDREAQAMARLNHPHVVTVYELGDWTGGRFIAMELIEGKTLDAWLPGTSLAARRQVLLDAGRGLAAAHQAGVVHRDFKPRNLLVGADGRVRVTDFGLSRPLPSGTGPVSSSLLATQHGALVGTPAWMSPEQLDGRTADERSDQFAFCVVWVEALTGKKPFYGASREALREAMRGVPALGRELSSLERGALLRGLSEDPSARFDSLEALLTALTRKPKRWPLAVGTAVLLLAGGVGWKAAPRTQLEAPSIIELAVGKMHTLETKCLARVAVGDPHIADVKTLGDGELLVVGASAGETTLLVWDCNNWRFDYTVRVTPAK